MSKAAVLDGWSIDAPVRKDYLIFGSPQLLEREIEEVVATLRSGWIGTGPKVARFEQAFREYLGSGHAMAVNSCTAALHLAMIAIDLQPGDEILVFYDGVKYKFIVENKKIILPTDLSILEQHFDTSRLVLVTCLPAGTYLKRGVVTAKLVPT